MRPLNKKYFGPLGNAGQQIQVTAWVPGDSQARVGSIVKQKGTSTYIVDTTLAGGLVGKCSLVGAAPAAEGQMTLAVFPAGSSQGSGATAHAVLAAISAGIGVGSLGYNIGDILTVSGGVGTPATFEVTDVDVDGAILDVEIVNPGAYTELPAYPATTTVVPAGGTGATLDITYTVSSVVVDNGGVDYSSPVVSFGSGAATATAIATAGAVTSVTVTLGGSYTIAVPEVTITETGSGVTEFARKLSAHLVTTFSDHVFVWKLQGQPVVDGEANIQSA